MKLVINHLTRLKPGYICVAGLDLDTGKQVRPVIAGTLITRHFIERGFFGIGQQVDLGTVRYVGRAPELEDYCFEPGKLKRIGPTDPAVFWQTLEKVAPPTLAEIFGSGMQRVGHNLTFPENQGAASLGNWQPTGKLELAFDGRETLRLNVSTEGYELNLPITDLRFYENDNKTLKPEVVDRVATWLTESVSPVILSVGLSRAWQKPGDTMKRHWLQLNNLHFKHQPIW